MNKTGKLEDVKRIYSHPHAIAQCRKWLTREAATIPIIEVESTAKAAEIASKDETAAAIASEMSELIYRLKIVHKNI
jgi:chorismate mutase/prephenate dehydratase